MIIISYPITYLTEVISQNFKKDHLIEKALFRLEERLEKEDLSKFEIEPFVHPVKPPSHGLLSVTVGAFLTLKEPNSIYKAKVGDLVSATNEIFNSESSITITYSEKLKKGIYLFTYEKSEIEETYFKFPCYELKKIIDVKTKESLREIPC